VLCDEAEVGEYLLLSKPTGSLSYMAFDNDNKLDVCALVDIVGYDGCVEDDNISLDFWKISWAVLDLKGLQNIRQILWMFLNCSFSRERIDMTVKETNGYMEQFLHVHEISITLHERAWKPVTWGEIYVIWGLFTLTGIIQRPTLRSYFIKKKSKFHTRI
jgi:hypothetical protein